MGREGKDIQKTATGSEVEAFLQQVKSIPVRPAGGAGGRLIFALDATASRQPTWERAGPIQAAMFAETADLGGLSVQLCHYGGLLDFEASPWCTDPDALLRRMVRVRCDAGLTQIGRLLRHALEENGRGRVNALVFIGDCMEENPDELAGLAGKLGLMGVPAFVFQEGRDPQAERSFRQIARLSGGAYCPFDAASPQTLRDLLSAVAVFAAGGRRALEQLARRRGGEVLKLAHQIGTG